MSPHFFYIGIVFSWYLLIVGIYFLISIGPSKFLALGNFHLLANLVELDLPMELDNPTELGSTIQPMELDFHPGFTCGS